jgi:imidazoleglycerol-phosphate dehydratase
MHHTVEDVGIAMGQALDKSLGERRGITRYGAALIPMDEALARVTVDISGRSYLIWKVAFSRSKIGDFDVELLREWFQAFAFNSRMTLHVETLYGDNNHHIAESCFKALARALRSAVEIDARHKLQIPSTKGRLQG